MLILAHRKINVLYLWLVSLKYINRLQSYGKSPITSGSPLVYIYFLLHRHQVILHQLNNYDSLSTNWLHYRDVLTLKSKLRRIFTNVKNFLMKNYFHMSALNIDCEYMLEMPH